VESQAAYLETLLRLETQHDDLLSRLEELDRRVVSVLREYQRPGDPNVADARPTAVSRNDCEAVDEPEGIDD